jgi:polyphosphate glucokinase
VFTPALIVVGGGVARKWDEYAHMIDPDLPVLPAEMGNVAGLVGAALVANGLSCK